jgi:hypothetical protein
VSFAKIAEKLPAFQPEWNVRKGVEELVTAYERYGLSFDDFMSSNFMRISRIKELQEQGRIDSDLRWTE